MHVAIFCYEPHSFDRFTLGEVSSDTCDLATFTEYHPYGATSACVDNDSNVPTSENHFVKDHSCSKAFEMVICPLI